MAVPALRAMLITAGFGTRLSPLTELLPKPAVPIANRPTAWFALDHLRRAGVRDFVLNTHHLAAELERELRRVAPPDVSLRFVHEPEILGTGGGVRNAWRPAGEESFVIMNGKLVYGPDLAAALAQHRASGALATMIVKEVSPQDPIGVIGVDGAGWVRRLPGFSGHDGGALRPCMYTGVSILDARVHDLLPENGCLIRDGYARWLEDGERIAAYVDSASFRDVGMSHAHYLEANLALASGRARWPGIAASADAVVLDPSANLGSEVRLRECVIGAGAELAAGVTLERCVVWPNTRVTAPHADAILLPEGRVVQVAQIADEHQRRRAAASV